MRILKRLTNNWALKLISLALAFLLWFLVVEIGDPKDDQDMGNVAVRLTNTQLLDEENKVYEVLDNTNVVRVTVTAPKSVLSQLRSSDIVAEADVSKITELNTVPIDLSVSTVSGVTEIKGSPESVKLNIEEKASKYVSLNCTTVGTVADGYVVTAMVPDQNRIEVSGPKSIVDQIRYAGAQIDVTDATGNLTANVDITLYDAAGNVLEQNKISKNVDHVKMSVEVLAVKQVPVNFTVSGAPEKGYMISADPTCDVESVKLAGSLYSLSRAYGITIPEGVLDVTGATEDKTFVVDIREYLPENTKLGDSTYNGKVSITVPVEAIVERTVTVPAANITFSNVPSGYDAEISLADDPEFSLELSGLAADIEDLRLNGIKGKIDVGAWMTSQKIEKLRIGTYSLPVTFQIGDAVTMKNVIHAKVVFSEAED
ncbi:MAG: hypothetical protein IJ147_04135 [Lachnospiraceae bacterium]|nr:hypothetical protein [Lachnospiraceae bacterium]